MLFSLQGFDIVLGADVCYSLKALPALFGVASQLLGDRPGCKFLLGYVSRYAQYLLDALDVIHESTCVHLAIVHLCRAYSIDKQILIQAQVAGFAIQEVPDTRRDLGGSLEGVVYSLTLQRRSSTHS